MERKQASVGKALLAEIEEQEKAVKDYEVLVASGIEDIRRVNLEAIDLSPQDRLDIMEMLLDRHRDKLTLLLRRLREA